MQHSTIKKPQRPWQFNVLNIDDYTGEGKLRTYFDFIRNNHDRMDGDILEAGVYQGRSILATALLLKELGSDKLVWGYDSFSGFPGTHPNDDIAKFEELHQQGVITDDHIEQVRLNLDLREFLTGQEMNPLNISTSAAFADSKLEMLERKIEALNLDNIRLVKGPFSETMTGEPPAKLFCALVDCDLYEAYQQCLPYIWQALEPGGYVYLDEYYSLKFPGALIASNEFFASAGVRPERHPTAEGDFERWFVTKP